MNAQQAQKLLGQLFPDYSDARDLEEAIRAIVRDEVATWLVQRAAAVGELRP